jgi:curved DNA-binding protein CbpA
MSIPDYYEFLQISPNAELATIQRVYRFMAGRLHPDNPETGDTEKFMTLKEAYDVLSDPDRRAQYDATYRQQAPRPDPLSSTIDFMDDIEGELNRRLAVLALLYLQRRTNPYAPEVSLGDVESRMGFPRDYLHFTMWYLRAKNYVTQADNSDFTLTAAGVDFVESNRAQIPVLDKLLKGRTGYYSAEEKPANGNFATKSLPSARKPLIVSAGMDPREGSSAKTGDESDESRWSTNRSRTPRSV